MEDPNDCIAVRFARDRAGGVQVKYLRVKRSVQFTYRTSPVPRPTVRVAKSHPCMLTLLYVPGYLQGFSLIPQHEGTQGMFILMTQKGL